MLRVAVELVTEHRFDGDGLAKSYLDLAQRGHLRGRPVDAIAKELEDWIATVRRVRRWEELKTMVARLPRWPRARAGWGESEQPLPDYLATARHGARRRR